MAFPYDFHPLAEEELFEPIDYLDSQREGYGALLAESAAHTFDLITDHPEKFPLVSSASSRRRALLSKPFHKTYAIYFDFDGERILITCFSIIEGILTYGKKENKYWIKSLRSF